MLLLDKQELIPLLCYKRHSKLSANEDKGWPLSPGCSEQVGEPVIEKLLITVAINQHAWNLDFMC